MDIGDRIKSVRERRGLEQLELAHRVNISQSKMNKIETGYQKRLEPDIIRDIAKELGVSMDFLFAMPDDSVISSYEKIGISDDDYKNLTAYQQEVIDWAISQENMFFKNQSDNIMDMLERLEIAYEVDKAIRERRKNN